LTQLLDYGPPASDADQQASGFVLRVLPRLGTISAWASKATDIAHNCGFAQVQRIERGIRYVLTPERTWLKTLKLDAKMLVLAADCLHDRMTETVVDETFDPQKLFASLPGKPMQTVAVMAQGAEGALLQAGSFGGTLGTLASGLFLLGVGLVNLGTLGRIWRSLRSGAAEPAPAPQGLLAWATAPLLGSIRRARHMYPLGLLFGLGFDTAAAIGLLALGATQALQGLPPWQAPALLMVFPALFTAAMLLVDTADSVLMTRAYGWAFVEPQRKLRYNFVVTALSVVLALLIGGTELLGLIGESWALPALVQASLDAMEASLGLAGFGMIAVFALCWGGAVLLQRRQEARAG
jgi:HoxN/HupN/NixA family high-affinity nickel-transporter